MVEKQEDIVRILKRFYSFISKEYAVSRVILYGSYSKGTAGRYSDIDVAVVLKSKINDNRVAINCNLQKIALKIDSRIEPRCYSDEEAANAEPASILSEIIRTGTIIT